MKTIFLTAFNPFVTRNILETDVFKILNRRNGLRLVVFCPDYKAGYFKENFESGNTVIEGIKTPTISRLDVIFSYIASSLVNTKTRYIHQRRELYQDHNYFKFLTSRFLARMSYWNLVKKAVRFLDNLTISNEVVETFFRKYQPDILFSGDIFHSDDIKFLVTAKNRGVKTIGMVRSWDNITNKGFFRVRPDKLLVNNEIIKAEAIKYGAIKEKNIVVVGMPQFDYYLNEKRSSREEFFSRINLDPKRRLILFSPHGNRFHKTDWHIMQMLKEACLKSELPKDVQFLVRFPPNDDVALGDFIPDESFHIDRPARLFESGSYRDGELDKLAMVHLADSLYYSDVVIAYNSSLIIDAAAFDKPAIGVAFDGWAKSADVYRSVARFMEYDHTQYLLKTGGLTVVRSRTDLISNLVKYLKDPSINKNGRQKILETQCWKYDGRAGERIADFILGQVGKI